MRVALVVGRYYEDLADRLVAGARAALTQGGIAEGDVDELTVAGAYELPQAAQLAAASGRYAAVVCLGAVIRGETSHYDHICAACAHGIQDVGLRTGVPCTFGVLTVDTLDQALARSGGDKRNSGANAADAALGLVAVARRVAAG